MHIDYLQSAREKCDVLFQLTADIINGSVRPVSSDGARSSAEGRYEIVLPAQNRTSHVDVSVIVPTFNRPDLLVDSVESACRQRDIKVEVIVVNDHGSPIPPATLERFASSPRPITVVQHHRNLGLGASRNTGASLATGEWLVMLDDDDTLVDGAIRRLLDAADPETSFVFGDHLRQWYEGDQPLNLTTVATMGERWDELHIENPIICGSFAVRRARFASVAGYREDLPVHEDYNLHVRLLSSSAWQYVNVPASVYHCRQTLPRLNHQRLYWFGTAALNHSIFRALFHKTGDMAIKTAQRENQYAHMLRSLNEGCAPQVARSFVDRWWDVLRSRGLAQEIEIDRDVIPRICPAVAV
jgi:glycosyltransferase involved in cell wall biosynthesis